MVGCTPTERIKGVGSGYMYFLGDMYQNQPGAFLYLEPVRRTREILSSDNEYIDSFFLLFENIGPVELD